MDIIDKIENKQIVKICTRCKKVIGSTDVDPDMCRECRELGEWEVREEESNFDLIADLRNGTW